MRHDFSEECPDGPCPSCVSRAARRRKWGWRLRQLVPLTYRTSYRTADGNRHFAVWRMWLGRVFAHDDVTLA